MGERVLANGLFCVPFVFPYHIAKFWQIKGLFEELAKKQLQKMKKPIF